MKIICHHILWFIVQLRLGVYFCAFLADLQEAADNLQEPLLFLNSPCSEASREHDYTMIGHGHPPGPLKDFETANLFNLTSPANLAKIHPNISPLQAAAIKDMQQRSAA